MDYIVHNLVHNKAVLSQVFWILDLAFAGETIYCIGQCQHCSQEMTLVCLSQGDGGTGQAKESVNRVGLRDFMLRTRAEKNVCSWAL